LNSNLQIRNSQSSIHSNTGLILPVNDYKIFGLIQLIDFVLGYYKINCPRNKNRFTFFLNQENN